MKKIILSVSMMSLLVLASCGKSEVCGCADTMLEMAKEAKGAGSDMAKIEAIQKKYNADIEKCQKLDEGKTDEQKKEMEKELKACDSFKEMEKLMK